MNSLKPDNFWGLLGMIGSIIAIVVAMVFLLDGILPDVGRAKDSMGIIQSFVAIVAIVTGAYLAHKRFQLFRTFQPHLTITHRISHRRLSSSYIHIDATAILLNNSKVQVELLKGFVRLQQVSPISDEEAESLYARVFEDREYETLPWPVLEEFERLWSKSELIVEPGESHAETFEFIVRASDFRSVLIYTYFYNPNAKQETGTAEGWAATTVYDIMEPT